MPSYNVLIVDDAPETRIFLKGLVSSLGYTSFEAKSGIDALKILNDQKIDLVILDLLMPNMDGYQTMEFINQLRQNNPIKVIFLTGKKGELEKEKILKLKPDDYIHKSVDVQVLKTKLKKLLSPITPELSATPTSVTPNSTFFTEKKIPSEKEINFKASITNMPMVIDVNIINVSTDTLIFMSAFQFKEGFSIHLNSPQFKEYFTGKIELESKVTTCEQKNDKYLIHCKI